MKLKLLKSALSCQEAIKDRYGKIDDDDMGINEAEAFLPSATVSGRAINIEVVGMKKINDLQW